MVKGSTPNPPRQEKGLHRASRSSWKQWLRKVTGRGDALVFLSVDRGDFTGVSA